MKKAILMLVLCAAFIACNSSKTEKEKEQSDSIAAAAAADSMLQAYSDTTGTDSVMVDSISADSVKK